MLHVKPSAQAHTAAPHCDSHCHPAPRVLTLRVFFCLLQMGTAAARNDLTMQYCMSHCRHIMQSVEIPAVTNARASGDYHPGGDQWRPLGTTGIFGWALAIAPTKDSYWSTDVQTGSGYADFATMTEPYNRLQAAVSTLSKGPVAPSDKIGSSNAALIMKSCAADGKLLQGDKPAMLIDSAHVHLAFSGGGSSPGSPGRHSGKQCRISVKPDPCPVAKSALLGYSAWTALDKKSGGGFASTTANSAIAEATAIAASGRGTAKWLTRRPARPRL